MPDITTVVGRLELGHGIASVQLTGVAPGIINREHVKAW